MLGMGIEALIAPRVQGVAHVLRKGDGDTPTFWHYKAGVGDGDAMVGDAVWVVEVVVESVERWPFILASGYNLTLASDLGFRVRLGHASLANAQSHQNRPLRS